MELGCHSGDCQDQPKAGKASGNFLTSQTTNKLEVNYQKAQAYIPAERRGVSVSGALTRTGPFAAGKL